MNTDEFTTAGISLRLSPRFLGPAVRRALRAHGVALCNASLMAAGIAIGFECADAAESFPAVIELRTLYPEQGGDGSKGFILEGIAAGDTSGSAVSDGGDLNGDGIDDMIVAAQVADRNGQFNAGEAYIVFGRPGGFPATFELNSLFPEGGGNGTEGLVVQGMDAFDYAGHSVSRAGDVNGDGIDDVIVAAFRADPGGREEAGEVYVIFGRATRFPPVLDVRSLFPAAGGDGSRGFVIRGIAKDDQAGQSVSAADVNGDGIDDLVIGAYLGGPDSTGQVYVVFGRTTGFPPTFELSRLSPASGGDGSEGVILKGIDTTDRTGRSVSGAGDVNGDGIDDVMIGSSNAQNNAGEIYVVFGRTTGFPAVLLLRSLLPAQGGDGTNGFVLEGIDPFDLTGYSVSDAGDVNGDGVDDLLIGSYAANARSLAGETYLVFGRTTGFPPVFPLRSLRPGAGGDGSTGVVIDGIHPYDEAGKPVSGAGDVNGDGIDDLVIGAHNADPHGVIAVGEAYVVFGRSAGFPAVFELRNLKPGQGGDGSEGVVLEGSMKLDFTGGAVSGAGDVNADGVDDVLVSAPGADPNGQKHAGVTYVVLGRRPAER